MITILIVIPVLMLVGASRQALASRSSS